MCKANILRDPTVWGTRKIGLLIEAQIQHASGPGFVHQHLTAGLTLSKEQYPCTSGYINHQKKKFQHSLRCDGEKEKQPERVDYYPHTKGKQTVILGQVCTLIFCSLWERLLYLNCNLYLYCCILICFSFSLITIGC